jgi:regulator of protease activity HflC (stomatin/prohibitin superfamily)
MRRLPSWYWRDITLASLKEKHMVAKNPSQEREVRPVSGFLGLVLFFALLGGGIFLIIEGAPRQNGWLIGGGIVAILSSFLFVLPGLFVCPPNESRVLVLFGRYVGTVKGNGFFMVNPFTLKHRVSVRAHTLNSPTIKVNDKAGNPIEIAAIVVWQVRDTYAAMFDVESYVEYVASQSESAVRKLAAEFHYDAEEHEITLRGSTQEVSDHLMEELAERLARAGVQVLETRISHLAYAPEIAHAMLQRQQAQAVIAARTKIVEGAVSMVEMALHALKEKNVIDLDPERRAAMVSNLLVVLCSDRTTPVINTGTLYT